MDEHEFKRIKDANEASVQPNRTIIKLCESIDKLRLELGYVAVERDEANLQIRELKLQIGIWKEYREFLNQANEGAITLAYAHGWRCPQDVYQKGVEFRKKLGEI